MRNPGYYWIKFPDSDWEIGRWDGTVWCTTYRASRFIAVEEFQQITYTKIIEEIPMGVN